MRAYMKSALPFHGVRKPEVQRIVRAHVKGVGRDELLATASTLWEEATHREEQYPPRARSDQLPGLLAKQPEKGHRAR